MVDSWRYGGRWWEGEPGRTYYHLELAGGEVVVVYQEDESGSWTLALCSD